MTTLKQMRNEKLEQVRSKELELFAERLLLAIPKMLDKYPLKNEFYLKHKAGANFENFVIDESDDLVLWIDESDLYNITKNDKIIKMESLEFFDDCLIKDNGAYILVKF